MRCSLRPGVDADLRAPVCSLHLSVAMVTAGGLTAHEHEAIGIVSPIRVPGDLLRLRYGVTFLR